MVITSGNEITPISYKCNVLLVPFWHFTRFLDSHFQHSPRLLATFSPMDSPNRANTFSSICQSGGSSLQACQGSPAAGTVKSLLCSNHSELVQFLFVAFFSSGCGRLSQNGNCVFFTYVRHRCNPWQSIPKPPKHAFAPHSPQKENQMRYILSLQY